MSSQVRKIPISSPLVKRPRVHDDDHLAFVSTLPCIITGIEGVQVCHIRTPCLELGKTHTGRSEKPSDIYVLPMTPEKHELQHSMNEEKFWDLYGPGFERAVVIAQALYINSGNEETCRKILNMARR